MHEDLNCDIDVEECEHPSVNPVISSKQITNKLLLCKGHVKTEDEELFVDE
eukprot:CAMPEP_0168320612 /NCGR_PEP_ID=MMETSP0213-20121227/1782_1 /TAXON_ID=151035 /ORGANISM="Euplotes harpa, Strain FSP1.4" /LENGTH=50 /DNA_ID=CAMNT_0008322111 /DNA_START=27 /DNA_END=179 /DNA_ORIENTATION=+